MIVQELNFFDKFGKNLNLLYDVTDDVWKGRVFFEEISAYLFDNENIFILEKVGTDYKFPTLNQGEYLKFSWKDNKNSDEFFLYNVVRDVTLLENFIVKEDLLTISHSDYTNLPIPLDVRAPLQVNVAFSPSSEELYERQLLIYFGDGSTETLIGQLDFYGEGVEEEERFKNWAQNFGIKFLREDANILKDYDIKEAYPDVNALNQARKNLLVNKEEIFPYIGTYKGLANFVNILGYKDTLRIKEYWKNNNSSSAYFEKLSLVDITDYLDDGKIDSLDLVDANSSLIAGKQFKKTEFLALVYEFTQATDSFDDDGIPIVQETTEFGVNEIFYKLDKLSKKLKNEFIPINVKIRDIIGEFIYFQKLTINYWSEANKIFDWDINTNVDITVYPGSGTNLVLRSLDPLYRKKSSDGVDLGIVRYNETAKNPFENFQKWDKSEITGISEYITEFYDQIRDQRIPDLSARLSWEFGDDPQRVIGAPVIFGINIEKLTLYDLRGVMLQEFDSIATGLDPYWTLENLYYRNYYEVKWRIVKGSPNAYNFELRGKFMDFDTLPHFLPYAGQYRVIIELYDFYGNVSTFSKFVEVSDQMRPEIIGFTRLEDKFDYRVSNLKNVRLIDFGGSPLYYPKINVLDNEDASTKINLYKNLTEWISFFKNRYGMGQNIYDAELYNDDTQTYVPYLDPAQNHPKKLYWGLGEDDTPVKIKDFRGMSLESLYWLRLTDLIYLDDFNAGFYLVNPQAGETITISDFSPYVIPTFTSLLDLINILNTSIHPGIRLFHYELINGKIHAEARYLSKEMYHMLALPDGFSPGFSPNASPMIGSGLFSGQDKYTFFLPKKVFSRKLIDYLEATYPFFEVETMFLLAKTSSVISGAAQDPMYWEDENYWYFENDEQYGYLPTTIDQNAFNINDIKMFNGTFACPENAILFFVINNIDGKEDFIWTLINDSTGEEVIRIKSVPFFVWKFKGIGKFSLKVEVIDNRKTKYENIVQNFIRVLEKRDYITDVEFRLNDRKNKLIKNRPY